MAQKIVINGSVKTMGAKGKKMGTYIGRVAVRKSGGFDIKTEGRHGARDFMEYCSFLQHPNGYNYYT